MLTLLTATGARPSAWALCERWMAAQDYAGPVRWVIVDDGEIRQPVTFCREGWSLEVLLPSPRWRPGQNTQARNLLTGLELVGPDDRVACLEDDDHYAPDWLSHVDAMLDKAELVGEMRARYYNVATRRGKEINNTGHASLCATAMRGAAINAFRASCMRSPKFIDLDLWLWNGSKHLFDGHRVTGIKGLPGRGGIGIGHRAGFAGTNDTAGNLLRDWIGDDAEAYA